MPKQIRETAIWIRRRTIHCCLRGLMSKWYGRLISLGLVAFTRPSDASLFPTHNPTHRMRCLVRLTRCLAVPAVLYVVVKPNHAPLIRARSVVQVHPGPPFKSPMITRLFSLFTFLGPHGERWLADYGAGVRMAAIHTSNVRSHPRASTVCVRHSRSRSLHWRCWLGGRTQLHHGSCALRGRAFP